MKISIRNITEFDYRLIFFWRNLKRVRNLMGNSNQLDWKRHYQWSILNYEKVFIYSINGIDIGALQLNPLDEFSFDAGIYCGNEDYLNTHFNALANLWLLDRGFKSGFRWCKTKVKKENLPIICSNKRIGFKVLNENKDFYEIELNSAEFYNRNHKLLEFIKNFELIINE